MKQQNAAAIASFVFVLVYIACRAAYGHFAYGEAACGFKHCVVIK